MRTTDCYGVYLAAGNSSRFHGNKLLAETAGKPLYTWGLSLLVDCIGPERLVVVTQYDEIRQEACRYGCMCEQNPDSSRGISSSIAIGLQRALKAAEQNENAMFLFLTADQPFLEKESIRRLLREFSKSDRTMACLGWKGEWYHPCVFEKKWAEELLSLTGDKGGKRIMKKYPSEVLCVEAGALRELTDIDESWQLSEIR